MYGSFIMSQNSICLILYFYLYLYYAVGKQRALSKKFCTFSFFYLYFTFYVLFWNIFLVLILRIKLLILYIFEF